MAYRGFFAARKHIHVYQPFNMLMYYEVQSEEEL
jgi:hypothetical protein